MPIETILKNLQDAVAALDQLDEEAVADDDRLVFIADLLRTHANRIAPWTRVYPIIPLQVGGLCLEIQKRYTWSRNEVKPATIMDIVQRACAHILADGQGDWLSYDGAVERICLFVKAYAMGAGITLIAKEQPG